jgi:hypothetical protein
LAALTPLKEDLMELALADIALGDVVCLPDSRSLTVRSVVQLAVPVGSMSGFVLLGELEMLLSVPTSDADPLGVYLPVERFPVPEDYTRVAAEGAARYWAPHLPAVAGAMGEILFRVLEVRGAVDPIVVVYRGPDVVVFIRTGHMSSNVLRILRMQRPIGEEQTVDRYAASVQQAPHLVPVEQRAYETLTR